MPKQQPLTITFKALRYTLMPKRQMRWYDKLYNIIFGLNTDLLRFLFLKVRFENGNEYQASLDMRLKNLWDRGRGNE